MKQAFSKIKFSRNYFKKQNKKYMKAKILLTVFAAIVLFIGCEKFKNNKIEIINISNTGCKNTKEQIETIRFKANNSQQLEITHSNTFFACCPNGTIKVESSHTDKTINLNELYTETNCNCLCAYDLNYTIANLEYGHYNINIYRSNDKYFELEIEFNSNTDTIFTINK